MYIGHVPPLANFLIRHWEQPFLPFVQQLYPFGPPCLVTRRQAVPWCNGQHSGLWIQRSEFKSRRNLNIFSKPSNTVMEAVRSLFWPWSGPASERRLHLFLWFVLNSWWRVIIGLVLCRPASSLLPASWSFPLSVLSVMPVLRSVAQKYWVAAREKFFVVRKSAICIAREK